MIQIDDKMVIVGVDLGFQFVKTRNYVFENGCKSNKKTFLNFCIEDVRNPPRSFVLSMVLKNGTTSLVEMPVLWQMRSLTVLLMTATVSTSQVLMQSMTSQCGKSMDWTKRYASKLA